MATEKLSTSSLSRNKREGRYAGKTRAYVRDWFGHINYRKSRLHFRVGHNKFWQSLKEKHAKP